MGRLSDAQQADNWLSVKYRYNQRVRTNLPCLHGMEYLLELYMHKILIFMPTDLCYKQKYAKFL